MNVPTGYTALDLVGFSDKGNYSNVTNYVQNDLVHYSGNIWRCKVDDTLNITPAENANWTLWIGEPTNLMEAIIAPIEYSPATAVHSVGDQLIYNDVLYKVIAAIFINDNLTVDTNIVAARKIVYQISGLESDIATIEPISTASQNYAVGEYLFYDWDLYRVTSAITAGDPITTSGGSANVTAVTVGDELKALKSHVTQTDSNLATVESGTTASRNYSHGEFVTVGGILYKVTASGGIYSGATFTPGTNITAAVLGAEVSALNQSLSADYRFGTSRTIASGEAYVAPTDGYLTLNVKAGKELVVYFRNPNDTYRARMDYSNTANTGNYYSLYIRKGIEMVAATYDSSTDGMVTFYPVSPS